MTVLVGMNFYRAAGDPGRRQERAIRALRALPDVCVVNLQWRDEPFEVDGIPTRAVLQANSRTISGREGRRKPIISEMFDALAVAAAEHRCRYFIYANSDIEITPQAISLIDGSARDGFAFVRTDLDPETGVPLGPMRFGVDAFAFSVAWWGLHRHRFRAYIAGEPAWDNVYLAVLLTHSNGELIDQQGMVLHQRHDSPWMKSPFDDYTWYLAALDRPYFALWARFHADWVRLVETPAVESAMRALRGRIFTIDELRRGRVVQWGRALKARVRYAVQQHRRRS